MIPPLIDARREDRLLFAATRQHLRPDDREHLTEIVHGHRVRWHQVYTTARDHGVAPLVGANLRQCPSILEQMPTAVRAAFERCTRNNVLVKSLHADRIRGVLDFFANRRVPVLLAKGAALDVAVYEHPWYTLSADIDLIVGCRLETLTRDDRDAAFALIAGRNPLERRIPVEGEWYNHHDISMNDLLPVDFAAIWQAARPITVGDRPALVMAPEHMLLAACINSCRKRFFRLKSLCDIAAIIEGGPIRWDRFADAARSWCAESIAYTALLVAAMTRACPIPQWVLDGLQVGPLRRRVIRFLSERQSFTSLAHLGQRLGTGIVLPLAVYRLHEHVTNVAILRRYRRLLRRNG